jgi:hypothetical protein
VLESWPHLIAFMIRGLERDSKLDTG